LRLVVENLLRVRFSLVDEELAAIIEPFLELPPEVFGALLLQLFRNEVISHAWMTKQLKKCGIKINLVLDKF